MRYIMTQSDDTHRARKYASGMHGNQTYGNSKYGDGTVSYVTHLDDVAEVVSICGPVAIMTAYLHDVLEDTKATYLDLENRFGANIALMVLICTDSPGMNRRERKQRTNAALATIDDNWNLALMVKLADRLCNVRACVIGDQSKLLRMYEAEHDDFKSAVYRSGWGETLWQELDRILKTMKTSTPNILIARKPKSDKPVGVRRLDYLPLYEAMTKHLEDGSEDCLVFTFDSKEAAARFRVMIRAHVKRQSSTDLASLCRSFSVSTTYNEVWLISIDR